jgi:TP53 regulating kinase and related kinases
MKNWKEVCFEIGKNIALLHDAGIIHGDLTTSNMIWVSEKGARPPQNLSADFVAAEVRNAHFVRTNNKKGKTENVLGSEGGRLYFIDFGLGFANGQIEDKAVDLYLIKEALEAKHFKRFEEYFSAVVEGYKDNSKNWKEVLTRLEKVEKRGRYKEQY